MDLKTIFKQALEQAALGDLQFTLRIAEQRMQTLVMPESTVGIMRDMRARELSLIGVRGTKAMQTESLRLVSRYRASIPGYAAFGISKLAVRLKPLSLLDVQAIIHPAEPVSAPAPVKRRTVKPSAVVAPQPCQACAARVHARATNPKSKFGCPVCWKSRLMQTGPNTHECPNCGLVAIVNVGQVQAAA